MAKDNKPVVVRERMIKLPSNDVLEANREHYQKVGLHPLLNFLWAINHSGLVEEIGRRNQN